MLCPAAPRPGAGGAWAFRWDGPGLRASAIAPGLCASAQLEERSNGTAAAARHLCGSAALSYVRSVVEDQGLEIVGPAANGRDAIAIAARLQPPLALVDFRMPGMSGLDFLRKLAAAAPNMRIAVYTAEADPAFAADALGAGAHIVILKNAPVADLKRRSTRCARVAPTSTRTEGVATSLRLGLIE